MKNKKNKIILVNLPPGEGHKYDKPGSFYPATGIMLIGTILKKNGYDVRLIDGAVDPDYREKALGGISGDTAFVGFSTMTSQVIMAYGLAKKIKEQHGDVPVVFGGAHPTLFPEQTVNNPYIDIAVINEASRTVLELMSCINGALRYDEVKGIAFKDGNGKVKITPPRELDDINELPYFDFSLIDVERYLSATSLYERELRPSPGEKIRLMPILTGLGCCFRCAFCINVILKRGYRARGAESIIAEIKRLKELYGANAFLFLDEDFCINKNRLEKFISLVKEQKTVFYGRIWTRVSYFNSDRFRKLVPEMAEIGIRSIAMGAESGSQRILDYISKDIKKEDILLAAKEIARVNIKPRFSFIAGIEGEKKEETLATYKLCAELLRVNPGTDIAGPFTYRYYPGSPIFRQMVEKYGIKLPDSIEGWKGSLNSDGSIMVGSEGWTWKGFDKYSETMNNYISMFVWHLYKPGGAGGFMNAAARKILLWRISRGEYFYRLDLLVFRLIKKLKKKLKKIYSGGLSGDTGAAAE
ncbi:MAG: radical SAM protein [Candidatus Omnitrophota bacterium]